MSPCWALVAVFLANLLTTESADPCMPINAAFRSVSSQNGATSCKCMIDPLVGTNYDNVWIGCSGQSMSTVFRELRSLNETRVQRVHIWDSQLNIIPTEMFEKANPRKLIIENSLVSVVRAGSFATLGARLTELRLRNNAIKKTIDPEALKGLDHLQILDVSANKISKLRADDLDSLTDLRELYLNDNAISEIEDGAFSALSSLRVLSIQNNQLGAISRNMFKGLENLEELYLENNNLAHVDWTAFRQLKKLRVLDLGRNQLTSIDLQSFDKLEKLILNNNSLQNLKNVSIRDLRNLNYLSMDRNSLAQIDESDLRGLSGSPRLETLSLASNNISVVAAGAFKNLVSLKTLALQNNQITTLTTEGQSLLSPLRLLNVLILSGNRLEALKGHDLPPALHTLAADHNRISHVDSNAFHGLKLQRLFLHDNRLTHLPKGTFDQIDLDVLQAIDLTENRWQCVCEEEWLGAWLEKAGEADVGEGVLGCLAIPCDPKEAAEKPTHWATVVASVLAVVSVVILLGIVYLYVEDARMKPISKHSFRRHDSDMLRLINEESKTDEARGVAPKPRPADAAHNKSVRWAN
ncbi:unnamed protein product, partial [Mesorhabditis spiculigera]